MHFSFGGNKVKYNNYLSALWAMAGNIGLDEEELRDIVQGVSGQRSTRAMPVAQFNKCFRTLEGYGAKTKKDQKRKESQKIPPDAGNFIFLASAGQVAKINALAERFQWREKDGLAKFIAARTNDRTDKPEGLLKAEARDLIEALKAMVGRQTPTPTAA